MPKIATMDRAARADTTDAHDLPSEDEEIAAGCTATTLITAAVASDVERLARRIHAASARATAPFVRLSAGRLPAEADRLMQTCARLIELAFGGTLLLTDVEEMRPTAQDRILETLAHLQGGRDQAAVRLIAGTTAALRDRVAAGAFSERLFYRLNIVHIDARPIPAETARRDAPRSDLRVDAPQPF